MVIPGIEGSKPLPLVTLPDVDVDADFDAFFDMVQDDQDAAQEEDVDVDDAWGTSGLKRFGWLYSRQALIPSSDSSSSSSVNSNAILKRFYTKKSILNDFLSENAKKTISAYLTCAR